ncbi:related to GRR1-required for glucose repression and for glucose and cation transport [Sporisorium reilianum SRZ2]|uniref:Related to GRR1-required for glucose repression and for glucose and cation transport n=1 Tax=Sporisorium reilianum (strain SRZ2) TaxID=999809 RepID=E6ZU53_SPORE|nr:related to GRR1-required for glucose repression and for glucose and cation transport [Sporisorium reilianum SRZ2]
MSHTADSSPRGSNSPSPYPYQGSRNPIDANVASARAGPSSRRNLVDTEMEDRSDSPSEFTARNGTPLPRPPPSPSSTSQSDDGGAQEDFADLASIDDDDTKRGTVERSFDPSAVRLSRRGTLVPASPTSSNGTWIHQDAPLSTASNLPHEILLHIFKYLVLYPPDLLSCLLVCKSWCLNGVELLWHRPALFKISSLFKLVGVIRKPEQLFPYADFVRRLNFTLLANQLEDQLFSMMSACTRLERLTLAGCSNITDATLVKVFQNTPQLVAIDLTDVADISDATLLTLAANCPKAQGINLTGCKKISSKGVAELARSCKLLRRVKLCGCDNVDDEALLALTEHCPSLLEVDLIHCPKISDKSVWEIWTKSFQMRELRLAHCADLTDNAFPSARGTTGVPMLGTSHSHGSRSGIIAASAFAGDSAPTSRGASPSVNAALDTRRDGSLTASSSILGDLGHSRLFDHLRVLDLTSCTSISDDAVEGIVANVPRLKNLAFTKCTRLTDEALYSIAKLGKNLHYLHLGHVSNITDRAVTHLARSCTRLRYIDVACCPNLTDLSVTEIANNMPKLRRIGLVKVINLTDQAIYGLVDRYNSLERIHLSYCENVSVPAIFCVLQKLGRLTHLSLTGVPAFRRPELQAMCRAPPKDFNEHQRQAFCVYSGKGVHDLRKFLQRVYSDEQLAAEFGGMESRARTALGGLGDAAGPGANGNGNGAGALHQPHPQAAAFGAPVYAQPPPLAPAAMGLGGAVAPGMPRGGARPPMHDDAELVTRRRELTPAEEMYYEQQRQLARYANARRAAEDATLLNRPTSTNGVNRRVLADAQEARNPGVPLVGETPVQPMAEDEVDEDEAEEYGTPDAQDMADAEPYVQREGGAEAIASVGEDVVDRDELRALRGARFGA